MPNDAKVGAYTHEELEALWLASVDTLYAEPFLDNPDSGFEVYGQTFEQLARVSEAIDTTTQALFVRPWSGQSAPSAQGGAVAQVDLTIARTAMFERVLVIGAGVMFQEQALASSPTGPVGLLTGRRYHLDQELVFNPGEATLTASAHAAGEGYGYNNPHPGTINEVDQLGANLFNDRARVSFNHVLADNRADAPVPEHVNAYFRVTQGVNTGALKRVAAYGAPNVLAGVGGVLVADAVACIEGDAGGTQFQPGELIEVRDFSVQVSSIVVPEGPLTSAPPLFVGDLDSLTVMVVGTFTGTFQLEGSIDGVNWTTIAVFSGAGFVVIPVGVRFLRVTTTAWTSGSAVVYVGGHSPGGRTVALGRALKQTGVDPHSVLSLRLESGEVSAGVSIQVVGLVSLAHLNPTAVLQLANLQDAPAQTEAWRVLPWSEWGLTVTNALSPVGGRAGMLDALGRERNIDRGPREDDTHYAARVGQIADVVTPNAIRRACNRILAPYGLSACFREVGTALLPGMYWDLDPWDNDFDAAPRDRFKYWLDYADFRGFFLIGLPPLNWGEFGVAWDVGVVNAWDNAPALCFWDGYPYQAAFLYSQVYQAVNEAHAGGVGFELYLERLGCY